MSYHVILVGVAGTVYKSGLKALRELGMGGKDARALLRELHLHALECLHNIVLARRQLERNIRTGGLTNRSPTPAPRGVSTSGLRWLAGAPWA